MTDERIVRSPDEGGLSFARFVQLARVTARANAVARQREWELAAFAGWQVTRAFGHDVSWSEYRESMGADVDVDAPPEPEPMDAAAAREHGLAIAHKIIAADRLRRVQA